MINVLIKILLLLVILTGVILIYDARILTKRFFSFGDQNEGASGLKILGFVVAVIGGVTLFFVSNSWR